MENTNEVKSKLLAALGNIRAKICDDTLNTLDKIDDACIEASNGLPNGAYDFLRSILLGDYIIHCEVREKVPVSGY